MPTDRDDDLEFDPNPLFESLQKMIDDLQIDSPEELDTLAESIFGEYNSEPQAELLGMSPDQVFELTRAGWTRDALVLNQDVTVHDLASSQLFQNARRLLLTIHEAGAVKATATGAFNRKLSTQMFEEFMMDESTRASLIRGNKVFNQNDVPQLTLFRHLLPTAGLLLFRKGEFRVTKRGQTLLKESAAGELNAILISTLFERMNLSAMDHLSETPQIQSSLGFILYQISKWSDEWQEIGGLPEKLFLPAVLYSLPDILWCENSPAFYLEVRVLMHLKDLGLLEFEEAGEWRKLQRVRKTALFNQLISFNV